MSNYVLNKIVCTERILNEYFIDYDPFDDNIRLEKPYISFNKLFAVKSLNEYMEKYGECIYYGWDFLYEKNKEGLVEIKFLTKRNYPIYAIVKAIELGKDEIVWYACEDCRIYLSKFFWDGEKVQENTLYLEDGEYITWLERNSQDFIEGIENPDSDIWHYDYEARRDWELWESDNLFKRYFYEYPAEEYYKEIRKQISN